MDEKMKAAFDAQFRGTNRALAEETIEWTLDYLRSQQKPARWIGTKLVPYEERTFRIAGLAEKLGYGHNIKPYYAAPVPAPVSVPEKMVVPKPTTWSGQELSEEGYADGWNDCIDAMLAANKENSNAEREDGNE